MARTVTVDGKTLYCARDIADLCGITNVHTSVNGISASEKVKHTMNKQKMLFLTERGARMLLSNSKKPDVAVVMKTLGIRAASPERELLDAIADVFPEDFEEKYTWDAYTLDAYSPEYNIAVDCATPALAADVVDTITRALSCTWIRAEPTQPVLHAIRDIHRAILSQDFINKELEIERLRCENRLATPSPILVPAPLPTPAPSHRRYTQSRGPKVQRYTPDGATLLETYPGCAEAARDAKLDSPVASLLRQAMTQKTVYKGFRWAALDREADDATVQDIGATVESATVRKGLVAMLNLDRTEIVQVFCDQKAAAEDRKFKGVSPISVAISNDTKSGGYYFAMWHDCSDALKQTYLDRNDGTLPPPRLRANGRAIEQLDAATETVIGTFSSVAHVMKTIRIARLSLCEALKDNLVAAGYRWRYAAARPGDAEKTESCR